MAADLLSLDQVRARTGLPRSTFYRLRQRGEFPAPVRLASHKRVSLWLESEVEAWCEQRRPPRILRD